MKIYLSGMDKNPKDFKDATSVNASNFMFSFYYKKDHKTVMRLAEEGEHSVFLDSGAFSADRKGDAINIYSYIDYIKQNPFIEQYANLDVIGDPLGSLKNYEIMRKEDLNPIPVFHYGSDWSYLDDLISESDLVGLGGTVGKNNAKRMEFFDAVFARYPDHKYHGFGVTGLSILLRYNWYSVDSTRWSNGKKMNLRITDNGEISFVEELSISEKVKINVAYWVELEKRLSKGNLNK